MTEVSSSEARRYLFIRNPISKIFHGENAVQSMLSSQQVHTQLPKKALGHIEAGAKKVVISAPAKDKDTPTIRLRS